MIAAFGIYFNIKGTTSIIKTHDRNMINMINVLIVYNKGTLSFGAPSQTKLSSDELLFWVK